MDRLSEQPKKMSLKEAVAAQLEAKKNKQQSGQANHAGDAGGKKMQSQQAGKKVSTTRRKMGS